MTAVSLSLYHGVDGFKMSVVTVGTNAPGSGDAELRFNVQNNKNVNDLDLVRAIKAFIRYVECRSGATGGNPYVAVTQQPSGPPN